MHLVVFMSERITVFIVAAARPEQPDNAEIGILETLKSVAISATSSSTSNLDVGNENNTRNTFSADSELSVTRFRDYFALHVMGRQLKLNTLKSDHPVSS